MLLSLKGLYHLASAVIANLWFRYPSRRLTVIGVTGTDGKTTTATLIYEILKKAGRQTSLITTVGAVVAGKTYDTGFHVTTPSAYWTQRFLRQAVDHGDTHMVLEVTSHGLAQYRAHGVEFTVGVLTNVTHEHLDWHKSFENYLAAKLSLLAKAKIAVVNRDDSRIFARLEAVLKGRRTVTYGLKDAQVTPQSFPFTTKLPGEFNQYNCLAALAAARALGIPPSIASSAVAGFGGIPGRMEIIQRQPFMVIVDFAHTPNAISQALAAARVFHPRRVIHVFGSAGLRDRTKRPLMGQASAGGADVIVLTEEDFRTESVEGIMAEIASGIPRSKEVHRLADRGSAISFALKLAHRGDLVIITGKGHEKSLCRGKIEYPWSDQEEVRRRLT